MGALLCIQLYCNYKITLKKSLRSGVEMCAYNPSTHKAEAEASFEFEATLGDTASSKSG